MPTATLSFRGRVMIKMVVIWIYAQRYNSSGIMQGNEFQSIHNTLHSSRFRDRDGCRWKLVIAWQSLGQDGSNFGIYAKRFNASGVELGSEFPRQYNNYGIVEVNPSVAMDMDGDFVVTWQSSGQDTSLYGIYGNVSNSAGTPLVAKFRVNTATFSD